MAIHPTAIIDASATIAENVTIGPYSCVGPNVSIGAGTIIASHVVIKANTRIGQNNQIFQFASIGEISQDLKYNGEETWLELGDSNIIRESVTLHRGTAQDAAMTRIGSHNLFMANSHIAHDCVVGSHNIFANNVAIAGHVFIGDHVIVGGNSAVHQFCRVDSYAMIGGVSPVTKDVVDYSMVMGNPAETHGINIEGLRRKGWSKETIQGLREAYKIIFRKNLTVVEATQKIQDEILPSVPEVQLMLDSLQKSTRGIVR